MQKYTAVILAAGKGTRMNEGLVSPIPKVMFSLNGKPIIYHSVKLIRDSGVDRVILVVGYKKEMVEKYMGDQVEYIEQAEQLGTGHAVMMAKRVLFNADSVIVFYADNPLFKPETIKGLIEAYEKEKPTVAMLSVVFQDPAFWAFGRVIRDEKGEAVGIKEQKDCSEEELKIKECNTGFYIFEGRWLLENIDKISNNNAQKEYYLTDLIEMAKDQGEKIIAIPVSEESEALGINTLEQLKQAEDILKKRANS